MGKGGAIQKFIGNGLEWELSSDNDANITIGGRVITEYQETTGAPYFLVDKIAGNLKGLEARVSHQDGSFDNFNAMLQKCAEENNGVSCLVIMADGSKYTAKGGANIVVTAAGDGMLTTREGKLAFDAIPIGGEWIRA